MEKKFGGISGKRRFLCSSCAVVRIGFSSLNKSHQTIVQQLTITRYRLFIQDTVSHTSLFSSLTHHSSLTSTDQAWTISGALWEERLVMRGKLALPPNRDGAPVRITSFGISHDHSKFFTGDDSGRVYSWTC